ncbi:MAG TPA: hypothetical protein PKE49_13215 [Leptospiraceae bacterium]|nr:hypothetical protein [Leptospirales bacterium]HMX57479.1 hypothetical protein [Leptospiraceae bacterium]HMY45168.1 hypothetical protein [Leptospiraceae bacterium]HMZ36423.1 hypothetical protein [Leptospiraceae bacterium]HNE22424.1 hypothetical protein [Leptospiraceae bacterium]
MNSTIRPFIVLIIAFAVTFCNGRQQFDPTGSREAEWKRRCQLNAFIALSAMCAAYASRQTATAAYDPFTACFYESSFAFGSSCTEAAFRKNNE